MRLRGIGFVARHVTMFSGRSVCTRGRVRVDGGNSDGPSTEAVGTHPQLVVNLLLVERPRQGDEVLLALGFQHHLPQAATHRDSGRAERRRVGPRSTVDDSLVDVGKVLLHKWVFPELERDGSGRCTHMARTVQPRDSSDDAAHAWRTVTRLGYDGALVPTHSLEVLSTQAVTRCGRDGSEQPHGTFRSTMYCTSVRSGSALPPSCRHAATNATHNHCQSQRRFEGAATVGDRGGHHFGPRWSVTSSNFPPCRVFANRSHRGVRRVCRRGV
jgi:hypothetical protein